MSKFYAKFLKATSSNTKKVQEDDATSMVKAAPGAGGPARRMQIFNASDNFAPDTNQKLQTYQKSDQSKLFLCESLSVHYLFESLAAEDVERIIECMRPVAAGAGEQVIKQGDLGDLFYCLESGSADASVQGAGVVKTYARGECFGELALIYNSPRAASVVAKSVCKLWVLDLRTFRAILATTSTAKTVQRCEFLRKCSLLDSLSNDQIGRIAGALETTEHEDGDIIVRQGDAGDSFYIIESGNIKCTQLKASGREVELIKLSEGDYFGEMALMLNETRHASCIAVGPTRLLNLNRGKFNLLLGGVQEQLAKRMRVRILQSVPLLSKLPEAKLSRLSGVMRVQAFKPGACIIRQGETGSRFYIINEGEVRCTRVTGQKEEELTRLHPQEFFGERALITNEPRKANVIAVGSVECLVLERSNFVALLNEVQDQLTDVVSQREKDGAEEAPASDAGPVTDYKWEDLKIMRTIGTGTFGRVKLVQHGPTGAACALKGMNKADVVASHQETNIMAEKNLLFLCSGSPFVLGLLQTFNFPNQIFMLMEFIQGGELWSYIYEKTDTVERNAAGGFEINAAKFYAANVILAFKHLHSKNIAYRDLKPENLLIDGKGYVKVIDFGFAKQFPYVKNGKTLNKTFTLCGTPEYLAPEIVHSKGYDKSVDCWALGCLIYELYLARTPFQADYTTKIFQNIVNSEKCLKFPDRMDAPQKNLIRKLLHTNPAFRMGNLSGGIDDIMRDPFFSTFDWNSLQQCAMPAPYKPPVTSDLDATNFDAYDEETDIPPYTGKQDIFAAF